MEASDYNKMSTEQIITSLKGLVNKGTFSEDDKASLNSLISYISKIKALSYDDGMKIEIIDKCPNITLWATDKDCNIKFWTKNCENYYGRKWKDVKNKNFAYMFVKPEEQRAAHRDCVKIIDDGETFHNIAEDKNKYGRFDKLITNCFRIYDVETGEALQAEIAVPLPDMQKEEEYLEEHIEESREMDKLIKSLDDKIQQIKRQLTSLQSESCKCKIPQEVTTQLNDFRSKLNEFRFDDYRQKTHKIFDKYQCEQKIESDMQYFTSQFSSIKSAIEKANDNKGSNKRFKIALSFPGEHREEIIEPIANQLSDTFSKKDILYDDFHKAEFARPNLDTHLQNLYHSESELIIVCLCSKYNEKEWCGLEWKAIRDLMNNKHNDNIMFLRADKGQVDGIFGTTDGYIDVSKDNIDEVVNLIIERYNQFGQWTCC